MPVILSLAAIDYSLFTDYELGVVRAISIRLPSPPGPGRRVQRDPCGIPWIFGFADLVYVRPLILGLFEIGAALTPCTMPYLENPPAKDTRPRVGRPRV